MSSRGGPGRPAMPLTGAAALALVLLPLASGLMMSLSPAGREALLSWWATPRGWGIFARSMSFAGFGATVALLAAWLAAVSLPRGGVLARAVIACSCLPLLVPSSLMGVGWIMALGRDGVVTAGLRAALGQWDWTIYHWPIAAAATGLRYFGAGVLILVAGQWHGSASRAAERVFALPWWSRLRLRLGAMRGPAAAAWVLLFLLVQSDHILPGMFLVHTFGAEVLIQFNALMDSAGAAALALPPALLALGAGVALGLLLRGDRWTIGQRGAGDAAGASGGEWLRVLVSGAVVGIAVALPLAALVMRAGGVGHQSEAWRQSLPELAHSAWLALAGAAVTLLLAIPLAKLWLDGSARWRAPAAVTMLNLTVPASLLALGLLALPVPTAFHDSEAPLVLAYAARFAAVAGIVLVAGWMRLPASVEVSARVHDVSLRHRLLWLALPLRAPAAVVAFALVALLVIAELEMSLILVRPGPTTLGVRLYTLIHTAPDHAVAALAVNVLLLAGVVTILLSAVMQVQRLARSRW